jgi:hypothetical protein
MSWVWLVVYAVGWLIGYRLVYRFMASDEGPLDSFDRVMLSVLSALTALFWPLAIPLALAHRFARPVTKEEREQLLREREAELDDREAHIRQLERDLGIGDKS